MTVTPIDGVSYWFNEAASAFEAPGRPSLPLQAVAQPSTRPDWSDADPPWAFDSTDEFTIDWPAGLTETALVEGSGDLDIDLANTLAPFASSARVVIICPRTDVHVHHLKKFRAIGTTDLDSLYAFGFWHAKFQGWLSMGGPEKCFWQMDANSLRAGQLVKMQALQGYGVGVFAPLQTGLCRIDSLVDTSPLLLSGFTVQAADQQMLTSVGAGTGDPLIYTPQPAAHQGIVAWQGSWMRMRNMRIRGAGRAVTSAPWGECANVSTQYGRSWYNKVEFDGRRAPELNAARPRRCAVWMGNNERVMEWNDIWAHHSNLSRYAANNENSAIDGPMNHRRIKIEQITNTHNTNPGEPAYGGWTNASLMGWESVASPILIEDSILSVDNGFFDGGSQSHHLQFTTTGSRNPTDGGPLTVRRTEFRNTATAQLNGYLQIRVSPSTFWATKGYANTFFIYHKDTGVRLSPYVVPTSVAWPPSAAYLSSAGVSTATHYLIRN